MISSSKTTAHVSTKAVDSIHSYVTVFNQQWFQVDFTDMTINRLELDDASDISTFWSKIHIWGKEYSISSLTSIDWLNDHFRWQIEKVHTIQHITHNASLYKDVDWVCYAIRISLADEHFLLEVNS